MRPKMIEIYDPAKPESPAMCHPGNYDPTKHIRWKHRPTAEPTPTPMAPAAPVEEIDGEAEPGDGAEAKRPRRAPRG